MSIKGIKSVDFILTATGEGVVNHNGSFSVFNPAAGKTVDNHMFPKMRGMDPMQRVARQPHQGEGGAMSISLTDPSLATARLIVSSECIRAQLFRDTSFGLAKVTVDNVAEVLASLHGLVRGYLITEGGRNFARKSCLYVTDFECDKPELFFNQGTNSKVRGTDGGNTSIYSYFKTAKDLKYKGKASLSVEELQFIPMENSLSRSAFDHQVSVATGQQVAAGITQFLQDIVGTSGLNPQATFVKKAVRIGSASKLGDAGIVLNDDAIRLVAAEITEMLKSLFIRQGKGYLQVTDVIVDYNNSTQCFRAEKAPASADAVGSGPFAVYYTQHDMTDVEFDALQAANKALAAAKSDDKKKDKEAKALLSAAKKKVKEEQTAA